MANNAIGILFEVKGQGSIKKGSGQLIKNQLLGMVAELNKDPATTLKFKIDENDFNKQVERMKSKLNGLKKELDGGAGNKSGSGSSGGNNGGGSQSKSSGKSSSDTQLYRDARKALLDYYKTKLQYERKKSRNANVDTEYEHIKNQWKAAKEAAEDYFKFKEGKISPKETVEKAGVDQKFIDAETLKYDAAQADITRSAQQSWSNLTQKVNDYIDRVEFSASRDKDAAKALQELRNMANDTSRENYKGYDKLKEKLAEVEQYINKNQLATETWGQKFVKTFGSRVRSALAGILTAKIGQWVNQIYQNVVKLDKAMTDLQIATGKNRDEARELIKEYSNLAKQIGATTAEVAAAADTWLRQGYSDQEASTLIQNSTMLAKLGQMEAAEASTALTSAMRGYEVAVEDSISIVDKFTKVDMEAAASAGDIATAMAETAASAKVSGVSMDRLIGYIATVKEVTQDGAESVGTFYKTLFARMNNVAAGNFVDEETGEALNDVETVLNRLGIALRDTNGQFRASSDVLDEIGNRWESFDTVQQHAIATAMAGTRQQEKFIVLMENYGSAMEYAESAANSAGTAQEKFSDYTESLEGKVATLNAAFEQLSLTVLNGDWLIVGVDALTGCVEALNNVASVGDGAVVAVLAVSAAILAMVVGFDLARAGIEKLIISHAKLAGIQGVTTVTAASLTAALKHMATTGILGVITVIPRMIVGMVSLVAQFGFAEVAALGFKGALELLNINPVMLGITAAITAIAGLVVAFKAAEEAAKNYAGQTDQVSDAMMKKVQRIEEEQDELDDLIDRYYDLAEASKGAYDADQREEVANIQARIVELTREEANAINMVGSGYENLSKVMRALYNEQRISVSSQKDDIKQTYDDYFSLVNDFIDGDTGNGEFTFSKTGWGTGSDPLEFTTVLGANIDEFIATIQSLIEDGEYEIKENIAVVITGTEIETELYALLNKAVSMRSNLSSLRDSYVDAVLSYESAIIKTSNSYGGTNAVMDTLGELAEYKKTLINAATANDDLKKALGVLGESEDDIVREVEKFFTKNYGDLYLKLSSEERGYNYVAKGFVNMAKEVKDNVSSLSDALDDMDQHGALSLDTVLNLLETMPELLDMEVVGEDGKTVKFLEKTEEGYYKLNGSIDDLIDKKAEELLFIMASNDEESASYKNAYSDYESMMIARQAWILEEQNAAQKEKLQDQIDLIEEQKDAFSDLVDMRIKLLKTYKDEMDYASELAKKEAAVVNLQTKLSVSKLDDSAEGRARSRDIQEELDRAQGELDDFTLEHAVETLTAQLEQQNVEANAQADARIQDIKGSMDTIGKSITGAVGDVGIALDEYLKKLDDDKKAEIDKNKSTNKLQSFIDTNKIEYNDARIQEGGELYQDYMSLMNGAISNGVGGVGSDWSRDEQQYGVEAAMKYYVGPKEEEHIPDGYKYVPSTSRHGWNPIRNEEKNNFELSVNGVVYRLESSGTTLTSSEDILDAENTVRLSGGLVQEGTLIVKDGAPYVYTQDGAWVGIQQRELGLEIDKRHFSNFMKLISQYHAGGFVGDEIALNSNEEFAKLLRGEFISTPAQMHRFMEKTLPEIAGYKRGASSNEFNAPLIEITCGSVTTESLPKLEQIVNSAVKEIQKKLDGGMSRVGYNRSAKKLLV